MHVAEHNIRAGIVGGLLFGIDQGILANADLDGTAAAAKADVALDAAKLHVAQRTFAARVNASLDMVDSFDDTYLTGGDADKATMLALSTARRGRSLVY